MRMRRIHSYDNRLKEIQKYLIQYEKPEKNTKIARENKAYIDFSKVFTDTSRPLFLDVGTGKGQFTYEYAKLHNDINIIGIESVSNIMILACEEYGEKMVDNMAYWNIPFDYIEKYLPEKSIERIYLNFSTPKQKNSYANTRLTSPRFLNIYKYLLIDNGKIYQKTDDDDFFEYSVKSYQENGFELSELTRDMHANPPKDNIITEYEQKFISQGVKINRVVAKPIR